MSLYIAMIFMSERKLSEITKCASAVRKILLGINTDRSGIGVALRKICDFSGSRSAFYIDIDGEDYNYIIPTLKEYLLCGDDRRYLSGEIFAIASKYYAESNISLLVSDVDADAHLEKINAKFYAFLKAHSIAKISFASVSDRNGHLGVLGIVNPRKSHDAKELLRDIAVCFSISIYNKKHLAKTELDAVTDALTGLSNRVTYKRDLAVFDEKAPENFACMYIDVNELHSHNNKYGHAAGDEMLIFIANTI